MTFDDMDVFVQALHRAWCAGTSFTPNFWTSGNPARGQCLVTALLVRTVYGGEIVRGTCEGEDHFWNFLPLLGEIDLTSRQYGYGTHSRQVSAATGNCNGWKPAPIAPVELTQADLDALNADGDLARRYELLKQRYALYRVGLGDTRPPLSKTAVNPTMVDAGRRLVQAVLALHQIKCVSDGDGQWSAIRGHEYNNLRCLVNDPDIRRYFGQCCDRDDNHDGNCDVHSSPGVMRARLL